VPLRLREALPGHLRPTSGPFAAVLDDYLATLRSAPLSDQTRRTYASKVRQYLAWLNNADTEGDALGARDARDWAVRDYRSHLQTVLKRKPATVNNALAKRGTSVSGSSRTVCKKTPPRVARARARRVCGA
jgi:integrase/recombinase XerC